MVDAACFEQRNPQDFLRAVVETSNRLPWTRPYDAGDGEVPYINNPGSLLYVDDDYYLDYDS
jgi:hypothetical protein